MRWNSHSIKCHTAQGHSCAHAHWYYFSIECDFIRNSILWHMKNAEGKHEFYVSFYVKVNNEQSRRHLFFGVWPILSCASIISRSMHQLSFTFYAVVIQRMRIYYTATVKNKTSFGLNSIEINRIRLFYKSRPCLSNQDFSVCIMPLFPNYMHCTYMAFGFTWIALIGYSDYVNMMQSWILGNFRFGCRGERDMKRVGGYFF